VLTGRGADIIIIDDPLKAEQVRWQAANDWFDHTLCRRLNDARTGAIILQPEANRYMPAWLAQKTARQHAELCRLSGSIAEGRSIKLNGGDVPRLTLHCSSEPVTAKAFSARRRARLAAAWSL
jgi:hypothetical protein